MEIERDAYLKKPISRKHDGFNELKIRGYSVDVGLVTCTEKTRMAALLENNSRWILSETRGRSDAISSQHSRSRTVRN